MNEEKKTDKPQETADARNSARTNCYVVYKQGVCGHGVQGVSLDKKTAISIAKECAEKDTDDYHSYDVYCMPMDTRSPDSTHYGEGFMEYDDEVFTISKEYND